MIDWRAVVGSVIAVWWLILGCEWFCNRRAMYWLQRAKIAVESKPFDEGAYRVVWAHVETWMQRDVYLLKVASLGWFRDTGGSGE